MTEMDAEVQTDTSDEVEQMLDETNGNLHNNAEEPEENAAGKEPESGAKEKEPDRGITYSWVNPKISRREETEQDQNWSGRTFVHEPTGERRGDGTGREPRDDAYGNRTGGGKARNAGFSGRTGGEEARNTGFGSPAAGNGKKKKRSRFLSTAAGRWVLLVVMAVVFGLIAGIVSFGVERRASADGGAARNEGTGQNGPSDSVPENGAVSDSRTESSVGGAAEQKGSAEGAAEQKGSAEGAAEQKGTGEGTASTVAEVVSKTMPSVVTISTISLQEMRDIFGGTQDYQVQGAGSGVIVGENDTEMLIATNAHVVQGAQQLSVGFNDETAVSGTIKGQDSQNDLAVVAVKLSDISEETMGKIAVIELGDSDQLALGEQVVAMGNALGLGTSVTSGYVSALNRTVTFSEGVQSEGLIQTDAAINSGNSGGALVNMSGQLIGINEGRASSDGQVSIDNVGYSIPISKAKPVLESMMNLKTRERSSEADRGYLGITCANINSEAAKQYNMPVGVYVRSVVAGAAADQAGVRAGDVITELDGRTVATYEDLTGALAYYKSGETVEMTISRSRNGAYKEKTVRVTLSSGEAVGQTTER
jgi:serine protease Do